ncbi:uncharacterized protein EI97DRAFT_482022 [Westerdykella ornata]|uniref:Uncharacterized protein n=1 Tax=Westerdykella ornata TaxID=318751 RepID=A0A6A6JWR7_WESOR|nr:uncharacterized protein EI97DRAFT_482022 [Westerdykella ornata]KAF2279509.1 hypothetical protein EI97DRAFT_482022 [Westerdykella ornata]
MATTCTPVKIDTCSYLACHLGRNTTICGTIMLLSSQTELLAPGSPIYDYILPRSPMEVKAVTWIQNGLFYFLFGAHAIETVMFAFGKLKKHRVPFGLVWLKWIIMCLVGRKFCFEHFDNVVVQKEAALR